MSAFLLKTGHVRHAATEPYGNRINGEEFDQWLEQHDAALVAEIARLQAVIADASNEAKSEIANYFLEDLADDLWRQAKLPNKEKEAGK